MYIYACFPTTDWTHRMNISRAGFIALCAALPLALTGCNSTQETADDSTDKTAETNSSPAKISLGTLPTEDILPMWVAESEGLFEKAGIACNIHTFQSATELIAAVSSGEVDVAMTDPMVTASLFASGTDVRICWICLGTEASQGRFGIMTADEGITSLADLAGREIGVGSNTILEYVMDKLMAQAGIPADQVVKAELQKIPVRFEAMASGQVPAAALPASLLALGESKGFRCVADDTTGDNISQSVMIVREAWLEGEGGKAALEALQGVWDEAASLINKTPENYRALLVEQASLAEDIADTYPISSYPTAQLPTQQMVGDVLSWMLEKGYLDAALTYDADNGTFSKN